MGHPLRAVSVSRTAGKNGGSNVPHPFAGLYNSGKHSLPVRVLAVMRAGLVPFQTSDWIPAPFRAAFKSRGCPTLPDAVCRGGWVVHPPEPPPSKGEEGAPPPPRGGLCVRSRIPP